ncbi:SDR family oxidoreductase [Rhizobium sp. KVB221]|uniref:SDR family oxidoreductase n=1 Tax=Rhizobium setariae TaxID=2801340 RepID=A0A936YSK8_9HYPH|nr:SDR family oxidoreductase [Rhizobium setariae]MBL0374072.1 SDR family oxidoreductase [Rhizobium setariae]
MTNDAPVLLVTGGSRGIGASVCRKAAKSGWRVLINYLSNEAAATALKDEINQAGGVAEIVQGDTGNEFGIEAIFRAVDERFGRLDGLCNNAGVVDLGARVDAYGRERLERMFSINVIGKIRCASEAVKRMSTAHGGTGGAIVNLSSMAAVIGGSGQYVDYAASKGAIDTFTVGLAREVAGEGIRVNAVRPGIIETDIHASGGAPDRAWAMAAQIPMQRPGSSDEVADAVVFLLSSQASYVTGAILNISGGR